MAETAVVFILVAGGLLTVRSIGIKGWPIFPLGMLVGIATYTSLLMLQTPFLYLDTKLALLLSVLLPTIFWCYLFRKKDDVSINPKLLVVGFSVLVSLVLLFTVANLARFHSDSLNFLLVGKAISLNDPLAMSTYNIEHRYTTVPIIHALGNLADNYYLLSITPLVSLAILGTLAWLLKTGLPNYKKLSNRLIGVYVASGILLLVSSHAYLFHSFYLNGHLLVAAYLLLGTGAGWLIASGKSKYPTQGLVILLSISVAGLVFTRTEGVILAGIVLLPSIVNTNIKYSYKKILLAVYGSAILIHQIARIALLLNWQAPVPSEVFIMLAFGVFIILTSKFMNISKYLELYSTKLLIVFELALWLTLIVFALYKPSILLTSVHSVINNVAVQLNPWGWYLLMLAALVGALLGFRKFQYQVYIRFPITTFLPVMFLLAYLRGGAYRIHNADSLNRMLIQIVPVMVLFIILSIALGEPRFRTLLKRKQKSKENLTG